MSRVLLLLSLAVAGPVSGAELRGRVAADNKPVAGVTVSAVPYETPFAEARREARREPPPAAIVSVSTKADGTFTLTFPAAAIPGASAIRLSVSGPGIAPTRLERVLDAAQDDDIGDVGVSRAQPLAGRALDPKGGPVVGAAVTLYANDLAWGDRATTPVPATTATGADGAFRFDQAAPSGNRLRIEAPGFAVLERSGVPSGPLARPASLAFGATVTGVVLMPDRRTPAAGSLVRFEGSLASRWAEARRDGSFAVDGVAGAGSIVADASGRARGATPVLHADEKVTVVLAPTAALRGRVVDAATGAAIPRVSIMARAAGGGTFVSRSGPDGRYEVAGLPGGSYTLLADEPRYVAWARERVSVTAGQPVANDIVLTRGSTLTGRVNDPAGVPIEAAAVRLAAAGEGGFRRLLRMAQGKDVVRTARDGTFRATRLKPGAHQSVTVQHAEFEPRTLGGIELTPGGTRSITVVLPRGRHVRGVVKDEEGGPVPGAEVQLIQSLNFQSRGGQMSFSIGAQRPALETGADGRFEIRGLASGDYQLSVSKRGYAAAAVDPLRVAETSPSEDVEIVLHPGATVSGFIRTRAGAGAAGYRVMAQPAGGQSDPFSGSMTAEPTGPDGAFVVESLVANQSYNLQVVSEVSLGPRREGVTAPADGIELRIDGNGRIRGVVLDADGRPLTDFAVSYSSATPAQIRFSFGGGRPGLEDSPVSVHADDGAFVLDDVPAGKWNVDVRAKGYEPGRAAGVAVSESGTTEGVEIRLAKGASLKGQVVEGRSGRPVADAHVETQVSGERKFAFGMNVAGNPNSANTDADGRFEIVGLAPGTYSVTATHSDWSDAASTVELKDQALTVELRLGKGGSIGGVVVSGARPVAAASVALAPAGDQRSFFGTGDQSVVTDEAGRFAIEHLAVGRYSLTATLRSQSSAPVEAVLASADATQDVTITMAAGGSIRGVVSGLPEEERGGVTIHASGAEDYFASTRTVSDGTFELAGVPTGVIRLSATAGGFLTRSRSASTQVTVGDGQTDVSAEIAFETGFRVEGHVTRGDRPVSGAVVSAFPEGGAGGGASSQTDEGGGYALEGLKEGTYELSAMSFTAGGPRIHRKIEVKGDMTADLEAPPARLAGTVVEAVSGRPLGEATVTAEAAENTLAMTSDSAGRFLIEGLEPKTYRVTVRKPAYQTEVRELAAAEDSDVTVELRRGEGIGIESRDGVYGIPLRSLMVRVLDAQGPVFTGAVSLDSNGRGEVPSLAPGAYVLRADSPGYAPVSMPAVTVPASGIALTLTPGGSVEIQVGPETSGKPEVSGRILKADGTVYFPWIYSSDGVIKLGGSLRRLENVAPGQYVFAVEGGARREFQVQEGGATVVSLP